MSASRGGAVHLEIQIGLTDDAKDAQVADARNRCHLRLNLLGLMFEGAQVIAIELDGQLSLDAGDGLFHVVGDGLRVIPDHSGEL